MAAIEAGADRSGTVRVAVVFALISLLPGPGVLFAVVSVVAAARVLATGSGSRRQRSVAYAAVALSLLTTAATAAIMSVAWI